jgi:hypothetical protein
MRQNVGLSALIFAAIAFVIRTGAPGEQSGLSARIPNTQPQAAANKNPTQWETLEGPWLATRAFFRTADKPGQPMLNGPIDFETPSSIQGCLTTSARSCRTQLVQYFGISDPNHIQFLIAIVPDPLHSRLSLFTDSSIQAIEKGAANSEWIFATQWLPWIDGPNPEEKDPEKRREQRQSIWRQEKQPGILVFRKSAQSEKTTSRNEVLLIFLVGETPTAGVNSAQFQLARAYMRAIHEPSDRVRIQGPTFSGSFYSLSKLLADDRMQAPFLEYRVRSGTATSAGDGATFQQSPGVNFRGAAASTRDQDRYFRSALDDLRIDPERAAMLIEEESAYGAAEVASATPKAENALPAKKPIRVFRFPRDISHLRNAYREAVAASKSGNNPGPNIEFSIKDPATGEDSIPIFSGSQSPLSQNGVVNGIANAIQREGILLVRVDASNVLDMLFLGNVLKRLCPDTRLLVTFPDVLLVQAMQSVPLTGTLVLASYPAFIASNDWMGGGQKNQPVTFPDANSEGVYNATVLLLNDQSDPDGLDPSKILVDYHWREINHPPTWLLTLDHQGFLPVDVFPHNSAEEVDESWFEKVPPADATTPHLPVPPRIWTFASTTVALVCLALSLWIWWISGNSACEMDDRFSLLQIGSESSWRRFHIFALLLVFLLMEITIWTPGLRSEPSNGLIVLLAWSVLAVQIAVLIAAWRALELLKPRNAKRAAWLGVAGAAACLALWLRSCLFWDDRSLSFAFRALELRFGSSPTWPVITSLGALALFAFVHLARFYLAACQRPDVITSGLSTSLEARLRRAWKDFNGVLKSSSGLRLAARTRLSSEPILLGLALVVVGVILGTLFHVDQQMRSIDGRSYNLLAFSLQLLVIVLLLLTCVQAWLLWQSLQSFLASLGSFPLTDSFRPVDRSGSGRPIWVRRLNLQSIEIHVETIYVLHNMTILSRDAFAIDPSNGEYFARLKTRSEEYGKQIKELLRVDRNRSREETLNLTTAMRSANKAIAKETFDFLRKYWAKRRLVSPGDPRNQNGDGEGAPKQPLLAASPLDHFAGLAQRLVALHYSSFILYGVRQIQNLLLFLSSGFVLLMISLNCYTIQAPQFIGRLLLILFLIIAAVTLSCLAGLERDTVLSRMAGSHPGKLNTGFYLKMAAYGGLPALSLLASQFPSISNFLLSWVEPTLEAFK